MKYYSDLPMDMLVHPTTKDLVLKEDELAVRQSIRNLININLGDKPFHSEIGMNLKALLFENFSPVLLAGVKRNLTEVLQVWEPRAEILGIDFNPMQDEGALMMTLYFKLRNANNQIKLDLYLERVR